MAPDGFLPELGSPEFQPLRDPPEVRDLKDAKIGHLIGLMYQRAPAYRGIASALPQGERGALPANIVFACQPTTQELGSDVGSQEEQSRGCLPKHDGILIPGVQLVEQEAR